MPYAVPPLRMTCAAALLGALVLASAPVWAQATAEQQQACAPDAIKLCADTIPDIPKTTACMKAHVAALSPRCRTAFNEAVGGASKAVPSKGAGPRRQAEASKPRVTARATLDTPPTRREPRAAALRFGASRLDRTSTGALPAVPSANSGLPGLVSYEADIARSCRERLIDPFTCRNTLDALRSLQ